MNAACTQQDTKPIFHQVNFIQILHMSSSNEHFYFRHKPISRSASQNKIL